MAGAQATRICVAAHVPVDELAGLAVGAGVALLVQPGAPALARLVGCSPPRSVVAAGGAAVCWGQIR